MLNLTNLREKEKVLTKIISENTDAQSYTQLLFELSSIKEEIRKTEKNINLIQSSFQGEEMEKIEKILNAFKKLNPFGQKEAVNRVLELTEIPKYQKKDEQ